MKTQILEKVEIRMYNTGFGDCFLLSFYYGKTKADVKNIWIDFGSRAGDAKQMVSIANDILGLLRTRDSKPFVDVLVITHEHEDHISGFASHQAQTELKDLEIGQLWFAWTEDLDDPIANDWRDYQNGVRKTLNAAFQAMKQSHNLKDSVHMQRFENLFGFDMGSDILDKISDQLVNLEKNKQSDEFQQEINDKNSSTVSNVNDKSVSGLGDHVFEFLRQRTLKSKGQIHYKRPGQLITDFPGIRIYVLGPPEELNYVKKEQSSRSGEMYLQASYAADDYSLAHSLDVLKTSRPTGQIVPASSPRGQERDLGYYVRKAPFDEEFVLPIPPKKNDPLSLPILQQYSPISRQYLTQFEALMNTDVYKSYMDDKLAWRNIDDDYLLSASNLAMRLNSATNNTSLVLAFEIEQTGEVLFFPGDAQYGVWLAWQEDFEKSQKDSDQKLGILKAKFDKNYKRKYTFSVAGANVRDKKSIVHVEDLLRRTILYKVGHHGSHNATPKRTGLEKMLSPNLMALIPVDEGKAQQFHWDEIPYLNLLDSLKSRNAKYFRSDQLNQIESSEGNPNVWQVSTDWIVTYQTESENRCFLCTLQPKA